MSIVVRRPCRRRRRVFIIAYKLALLGLLSTGGMMARAETKAPPTFHLRLDTPLTSYATPSGSAFTATVISPLEVDGQVIIPLGSLVRGTVRRASAVGFGLVHERATLELSFHEYELADGNRYPLGAHLEFIENAREHVDSRGRIKGVLAASNAQGLLRGIWYRPTSDIFHRTLGLTGVGGTIWSKLSPGPVSAAAMLVARYMAFRLPEPEIQLRPGTEMRLLATSVPQDAPSTAVPADPGVEESFATWLRDLPSAVTRPNGIPAADKINLAFIGTVDQLEDAFVAAAWVPAEPRTMRTNLTEYLAYNSMTGYPTAPVSKLLYQGQEPVAVFEKSLNTITKRHHIRIWRAGKFEGSEVWLGAATHDAGVGFHSDSLTITHKIDPQTDKERSKVLTDLDFAGCSEKVSSVGRPDEVKPASRKGTFTDGGLAVIWLRQCDGPTTRDDSRALPPGSKSKRLTRRFVLETRQYFLRDNMYYWAYRAALWGSRKASRTPADE
jgi:hypothetical protein